MQILFVCSGNTCRSPLAKAAWDAFGPNLLKQSRLGRELLVGMSAASGGLAAAPGMPATAHARTIARGWGVSLDKHRSRDIDSGMAAGAELLCAMTPEQVEIVRCRFPEAAPRVHLLAGFSFDETRDSNAARLLPLMSDLGWDETGSEGPCIFDPFGGSIEAYQACAAHIKRSVEGLGMALATGQLKL